MDGFQPMEIPQGVAFTKYSGGPAEMARVPWHEIIKDVEQGKLKIQVGRTWKLEEVAKAHEVMEKGGSGGKMVILM